MTHDWDICFASGSYVLVAVKCKKAKPSSLSLSRAYSERTRLVEINLSALISEEDKGGRKWPVHQGEALAGERDSRGGDSRE
jgi:hypothetical protein